MSAEQKPEKLTTELSRELSLFHLTMMGLGMMIGAGVFIGIGNSIKIAGPGGVLLTFALNGVLALCTAMSYAELSSAIPKAGGALHFARIAFGKGPSFIGGWSEWFASSVAGSMYAVVFSIYTIRFLENLQLLHWLPVHPDVAVKVLAVFISCIFILINYRGASETGNIGAIMTFGQTAFLLIIGGIGVVIAITDPERFSNFKPFLPFGWRNLFITMGFTYVAFEGFEVIAQAGDEAINPRKNLPKAMLYSVFIAAITYVLVAFATIVAVKASHPEVGMEPWLWIGKHGGKGFGEAISLLIPKGVGSLLTTLAVIFASTSALNATIYSATRASYALGRSKMLPSFFAYVSRKRKTPLGALLLTSVIVIAVAAFFPTEDVASSASIMFLVLFFMVNISVIKIRYNMGDELQYGFVMPFFPVLPVIAIIFQVFLAYHLSGFNKTAWIVACSWVTLGLLIYFLYARKHALPSEDEIMVLQEEPAEELRGFRVMIPVANPENALSLVESAFRICREMDVSLRLLHMIPVHDLLSLHEGHEYLESGQESIMEAMLYLQPLFPISTTIRYCRNIARGIISAVKEKNVNLLLLGWHGQRKNHLFRIGSTLDQIISRAPCDIIIAKGKTKRDASKALVVLDGDINDSLCLQTAQDMLSSAGPCEYTIIQRGKPGRQTSELVDTLKARDSVKVSVYSAREHELRKDMLNQYDVACISMHKHLLGFSRQDQIHDLLVQSDIPLVLTKKADTITRLARKII
ncbi:MAG: amino acid permease [Spirochaetales bacterium]|nr:amino acid permease [Spirochaetales bacterium]